MWRNKKRDTPQAADPEPKSVQTNQPPMSTLASWEETTKMNKNVVPAAAYMFPFVLRCAIIL
jgi:hypothetical protein